MIGGPDDAKVEAGFLYERAGERPGLMMLNAQNAVIGWLPLDGLMRGKLRDTGGMAALFRAASESNMAAAIAVHGGELDARVESVTAVQNIGAALALVDVRLLDSLKAKKVKAADGSTFYTMQSYAETGLPVAGGPVFSRSSPSTGQRMSAAQVKSITDAIKSRWANAPEVVVAESMNDPIIPQAVRDANDKARKLGAKGEPEGFYFDGKVYVIADQMTKPGDVTRVMFHEALGHAGLRGVFGKALDTVLKQIVAARRAKVIAKARQYGLVKKGANGKPVVDVNTATDAEVFAAMSEQDRMTAAEEVLAEMAQENPKLSWVQSAIAAVRQWLRQNVPGFADMKMTDAEVVRQFILPARAWVERGPGGGGGGGGLNFSLGADSDESNDFRRSVDQSMSSLQRFRDRGLQLPKAGNQAGSRTVLTDADFVNAADKTSTPAFKKWFGDWEAVAAASPVREAVTLDDAKLQARSFVGKPLANKSTGMVGTVSNTNLGKMTSQKAGSKSVSMADHALAIANLDKLFTNAVLDHSHADSKGEPTIKAIHRFMAPMLVKGGNVILVKMTVKETTGPNEPNPIYTVEALEIENPPSVLARGNPDETGIPPQAGLSKTVRELVEKVKGGVSKVVDAEGKPMVMYHGTYRSFAEFDRMAMRKERGRESLDQVGNWFSNTPSKDGAGMYIGYDFEGANIMPVYLSIKSPWTTSFRGLWRIAQVQSGQPEGDRPNAKSVEALDRWMDDMGIDGIHIRHDDRNGPEFAKQDVWIARRPEQIKSAIGNNGDFDSSNPDILFSRGDRPTDEAMDFALNGRADAESLVNLARARDAAGLQRQLNSRWGELGRLLHDNFADAMGPAKRWIEGLGASDKAKRALLSGLYRGAVQRDALQQEAKDRHGQAILKGISKIAKKHGLDAETAQKLVGYWLTTESGPRKDLMGVSVRPNLSHRAECARQKRRSPRQSEGFYCGASRPAGLAPLTRQQGDRFDGRRRCQKEQRLSRCDGQPSTGALAACPGAERF